MRCTACCFYALNEWEMVTSDTRDRSRKSRNKPRRSKLDWSGKRQAN
ncbi:hypothetical protein ACVW0W_003210 [Bradyrhizobium sp. USDA 4469]